MLAYVSLFGLDFGALVGGAALLTEVVFGLHGIGWLTYQSLQNFDLPVIMATVMYAAFFVVVANAVVDLVLRRARPAGAPCLRARRPLLEVRDLRVSFRTEDGVVQAVDGLSLSVGAGEVRRDRRRVRLGQDRVGAGRDAPDPGPERGDRGRGAPPRTAT